MRTGRSPKVSQLVAPNYDRRAIPPLMVIIVCPSLSVTRRVTSGEQGRLNNPHHKAQCPHPMLASRLTPSLTLSFISAYYGLRAIHPLKLSPQAIPPSLSSRQTSSSIATCLRGWIAINLPCSPKAIPASLSSRQSPSLHPC